MLTETDWKIIEALCGDIGETLFPFKDLAKRLNIEESFLIERLKFFKESGIQRRFGAILYHQNAGFDWNGMSIWNVPQEKIESVGESIAAFQEVSHCYHRPSFPGFNYNIFGMIHAKEKEECFNIAKKISEKIQITDYKILFSKREFKKSSMVYSL